MSITYLQQVAEHILCAGLDLARAWHDEALEDAPGHQWALADDLLHAVVSPADGLTAEVYELLRADEPDIAARLTTDEGWTDEARWCAALLLADGWRRKQHLAIV